MKVVYLPLDERPCNLKYPKQLAEITDIELVTPDSTLLGNKKIPASFECISEWLIREASKANYLIVSIDMLLYGGIVPSRIHDLTEEDCASRMNLLRKIKKQCPTLQIYAFNLIMRVPSYNSNDEEPDYYEVYGQRISDYGKLLDKQELGETNDEENGSLQSLKKEIPSDVLEDFLGRRQVNAFGNRMSIDLVGEGIIDFLIIPLDDNAKYGFSSKDQRELIFNIEELNLMDQVAVYPGADEIGCTLVAKAFCEIHRYQPNIVLRYSSTHGPYIIPKYEDRSLNESIKSHLTAIGGIITDHSDEADLILMVNSPPVGQYEMAEPTIPFQSRHRSYFSEVNLREFVQSIRYFANKGNTVAIADVATCNGSDVPLMKLLKKTKTIDLIDAYAGWNTSGNTLGTVAAHGIILSYYRRQGSLTDRVIQKSREFYYSRLIEDWGYQSVVRRDVAEKDVPRLGGTYFNVESVQDHIESIVYKKLNRFMDENLMPVASGHIRLKQVYMPWKRMFEVGLDLEYEL